MSNRLPTIHQIALSSIFATDMDVFDALYAASKGSVSRIRACPKALKPLYFRVQRALIFAYLSIEVFFQLVELNF
jgi:hypothetical protein